MTSAATALADDGASNASGSGALRLTWTTPAGSTCPSTDDVRSATLRNAKAPTTAAPTTGAATAKASPSQPPQPTPPPLEADARVEKLQTGVAGEGGSSWRVRLHTRRGPNAGEREIIAPTCNGVADATAVILALALVPPGDAPADPPPSAAATTTPIDGAPAPSAEAPPSRSAQTSTSSASSGSAASAASSASQDRPRTDSPSSSLHALHALALGASASGDASSLPSFAPGGSLTVAWMHGRARVELDARRWVAQSENAQAETSLSPNAGARFTMTSLGGRACWAAIRTGAWASAAITTSRASAGASPGASAGASSLGSLELSPCLGGDVHLVSASGYGADTNYSASAQWTTIDGGGLLRVGLTSWLALRSRVDAFVPLTRPTFVVENTGTVYRPPTLGASASFGVEVLFL